MNLLLTAVRSLSFNEDRSRLLRHIPSARWPELLDLTDAAHISLAVATRCLNGAPESVRDFLETRLTRNAERHARIVAAHKEIAEALGSRGIDFVVLKGLTHAGFWNSNSFYRPQYDADIYVPQDLLGAASEVFRSLGYEPCQPELHGSDHLPTMLRRTGWRWRGDFFDPDQPLALELHFRFWNPTLGFVTHDADSFWNRKVIADLGGVTLPALNPVDRLRYAAWHAVRHLLRGSLRILHVYELAHFLHRSTEDHDFWQTWTDEGPAADRVTELIAFRLAREWFGCRMNQLVQDYMCTLPANIERWFELFAFSAVTGITRPNKDELFLNLCLAQGGDKGRQIAARRILPGRIPTFVLDAHDQTVNFQLRLRRGLSRTLFIARRAGHHIQTLPPLLGSGIRWWCSR